MSVLADDRLPHRGLLNKGGFALTVPVHIISIEERPQKPD